MKEATTDAAQSMASSDARVAAQESGKLPCAARSALRVYSRWVQRSAPSQFALQVAFEDELSSSGAPSLLSVSAGADFMFRPSTLCYHGMLGSSLVSSRVVA